MESTSSLMEEIRDRLHRLESSLPKHLDAMAVSRATKLPWKALLYREALIWRMAELSRAAFENFEKDRLVAAIVLTRAVAETFAALWYLWHKIEAAVKSNNVGDIDTDLMSLISGTRIPNDPIFPQAIQILKMVDKVNKEVQGFRDQYDILCEYTHPNASGTTQSYLQHNREQLTTEFGQNSRTSENTRMIGLTNLSVSLLLFEPRYNGIAELIPAFTALCEKGLETRASSGAVE
jgi:Asp-tRNA(Asn)/Glu-tRNA(Gln) amidotransferase A subunit family amidase